MASYLTVAEFKLLTIATAGRVEELEERFPGWLDAQLEHWSSSIDDRLRKRYVVPFGTPAPRIVRMWLCQLVTPRVYLKAGIDATDAQFTSVLDDAKLADAQITAAANAREGLFELPLLANATSTPGISRGGPKFYTQNSPYASRDDHDEWAREDDAL